MKKLILIIIFLIGLTNLSESQTRFKFGNVTLKDTNSGSLKLQTGSYWTPNFIYADGYYVGIYNKVILSDAPITGDFTISNIWDVATPEMRFWVELSNGSFRWLLNSGVTQMTLDIANGLRVYDNLTVDSLFSTTSMTVLLNADDKTVNTNTSYIRIDSDEPTAENRTFTLSNGVKDGQDLTLLWISGDNEGELLNGTGNIEMSSGDWILQGGSQEGFILKLKWDNTLAKWFQVSRSDN